MKTLILSQDVRQDHKGRLYRTQRYESGKFAGIVYVNQPTAQTEHGRTIPVPPEPTRKPRATLRAKQGVAVKHVAIVEARFTAPKLELVVNTLPFPNASAAQEFVDIVCRPLMRFDGKDWHLVGQGMADHYVQRHETIEEENRA